MQELRQLCRSSEMTSAGHKYNVKDVTHPAKDKLVPLLLQHKEDDLFPAGRFVSLWYPYKVMAENIKYIAEKRVVQVTYEQGTVSRCQAVSILATVKYNGGHRLDVEIYRRGLRGNYTVQHILRALHHFQTLDYQDILTLTLFFPLEDVSAVDELAKQLKFRPGRQSNSTSYLIGKSLHPDTNKAKL